jgi:hypothetical protein
VAVSVVEPSHGGFGTATATLEIKVTGTGPTLSCAATVTADADNTQEACFPLVLCVQAPQATISTQQFTVALDGGAGGTTMAHVIKVGAPTMSRTRSLAHRS